MTAAYAFRQLPEQPSVVEVYGSKFLLEWLDRDVLASAAARHPVDRGPTEPDRQERVA